MGRWTIVSSTQVRVRERSGIRESCELETYCLPIKLVYFVPYETSKWSNSGAFRPILVDDILSILLGAWYVSLLCNLVYYLWCSSPFGNMAESKSRFPTENKA